jgi:hypothetical protein
MDGSSQNTMHAINRTTDAAITGSFLFKVPEGVKTKILGFLSVPDLGRISMVSKVMRKNYKDQLQFVENRAVFFKKHPKFNFEDAIAINNNIKKICSSANAAKEKLELLSEFISTLRFLSVSDMDDLKHLAILLEVLQSNKTITDLNLVMVGINDSHKKIVNALRGRLEKLEIL